MLKKIKVTKKTIIISGVLSVGILSSCLIANMYANKQTKVTVNDVSVQEDTDAVANAVNDALTSAKQGVLSIEEINVSMVSEANNPTSEFDGKFIANIDDGTLNIRESASEDGNIVGKLSRGDSGDILEVVDGWTYISSGDVTGYVKSEFIITGTDAEQFANEVGTYIATVNTETLRVRSEANTEADIVELAAQGSKYIVSNQSDGWALITTASGEQGYVSLDYVDIELQLGKAKSLEAIAAEEEAAKQAEANKEAQSAKEVASANEVTVSTTTGAPVDASYDDAYLLACVVMMESGNESYEGKLAVANVVINRLNSGSYGSSISSVVYAKGQFPGASNGLLDSCLASGPNQDSINAANEALSGNNNIGGYTNFISVGSANYSSYSEYTVIGNHCFYRR